IYPIKRKTEQQIAKIQADAINGATLIRYYKIRASQVNPATLLTELTWLRRLSLMLGKRFEEATIPDMEDLVFQLDQRNNKDGTKNRVRTILKVFFQWLKGYHRGEYPPEVI